MAITSSKANKANKGKKERWLSLCDVVFVPVDNCEHIVDSLGWPLWKHSKCLALVLLVFVPLGEMN